MKKIILLLVFLTFSIVYLYNLKKLLNSNDSLGTRSQYLTDDFFAGKIKCLIAYSLIALAGFRASQYVPKIFWYSCALAAIAVITPIVIMNTVKKSRSLNETCEYGKDCSDANQIALNKKINGLGNIGMLVLIIFLFVSVESFANSANEAKERRAEESYQEGYEKGYSVGEYGGYENGYSDGESYGRDAAASNLKSEYEQQLIELEWNHDAQIEEIENSWYNAIIDICGEAKADRVTNQVHGS